MFRSIPTLRMSTVLALAAACFFGPAAGASNDWPGLRGPRFDGAVDATLFEGDGLALDIGWVSDLGSGYSAIAVGDGLAITMFAAGEHDAVAAFDVTSGKERWRHAFAPTYAGHDGSHDGPISTPLLHGGRVFGVGPRGHFFALEADTGKPVWATHLVDDHGAEEPSYGFTTSPVAIGKVVVVQIGAGEGKSVAGFDRETGKLLWSKGDDAVVYHSPIVARLGGREQVVAATRETIMGLDATSGEVLWSHAHGGDGRAMGGETIIPVPAGDDRIFLLNKIDSSVMLGVAEQGGGFAVEELWSNNAIRSTYVHPVVHEGYIYGMAGRIFTCVDAATGERKWRSREPGDGFPTLVGDHLVVITKPGSLHVIEATPERYNELTRIDLFTEHSWSAVAYADGHLFARSMAKLARIDPLATLSAPKPVASRAAGTSFGRFLEDLAQAEDKAATIDRFLEAQKTFPIIEPTGMVHFVYRGEAEDVGIVGDMIGFRREDPMTQVAGTDFFYYSSQLEPNAALSYGFIPNFERPIADPLNSQTARGLFGEVSWFSMPAWQPPVFEGDEPAATGRLEDVAWESEVREGQSRVAKVYLPAGYDADAQRRYPTVYVHGGKDALESGEGGRVLDHVIGRTVEPVIAVFVTPDEENPRRDMGDREGYSRMIVEELVPLIDGRFRTVDDRMARATVGVADGGSVALWSALTHGNVFGKVASQSAMIMSAETELGELVAKAGELPSVIYQEWGTYHLRSPHEAWDMAAGNRALWQMLRDHGFRPTGGEVPEGFGWACWKARTDDWLAALFPLEDGGRG